MCRNRLRRPTPYYLTQKHQLSPPEVAASLFRSHLDTFLIAYLKHAHPSHAWEPTDVLFVPERFTHVYAQFEQFIDDPAAIEAWWLYQFGNLSMEVDTIPLSPDARLRRSIQVERDQAVIDHTRQGYSRLKASWFDLGFYIPKAVLEVRRTLPSRSAGSGFGPEEYDASNQIAQALLLALRLLKAEPVSIESFQTRIDNPFADPMMFSELPRHSLPWGQPMMLAFASQYVIKSEDLGKLESLWRQAQSALRDPLLTVPLKRLDDSYLRTDLADSLIDSWIALEGLFLPEKYVREMADVAAEAIAHYLGKTVSERASTATLVRSSRRHAVQGHSWQARRERGFGRNGCQNWRSSPPRLAAAASGILVRHGSTQRHCATTNYSGACNAPAC